MIVGITKLWKIWLIKMEIEGDEKEIMASSKHFPSFPNGIGIIGHFQNHRHNVKLG